MPLYQLFKVKLSRERGAFEWELNFGMIEPLRLKWNSISHGAGVGTISLGTSVISLGIYLDGANPHTDRVVIESVRDGLGKHPAGTFGQAFQEILTDSRRPVVAAIRFKLAEDPDILSFVSSIERSMAVAFFESPPQTIVEPTATPASA